MGKPEDIPQDVWEAADAHVEAISSALAAVILGDADMSDDGLIQPIVARAIMAERERCADEANGVDPRILEGMTDGAVSLYCRARVDAAKAIRGQVA